MKRREWILLLTALLLIASCVFVLNHLKARRRLGQPGLKFTPIEGSIRVNITLPQNAPGFYGTPEPISELVKKTLPHDTSIAQMFYTNAQGQGVGCTAVMMGTDRTSIHKPQYCLTAQGYRLDEIRSEQTTIPIYKPDLVNLPVKKLIGYKETTIKGKKVQVSCVFVYWLVSHDEVLADQSRMSLKISEHILRTGEMPRFSYVFYLAECIPGREDDAFKQICRVINATLPQYQLTWPPGPPRSGD